MWLRFDRFRFIRRELQRSILAVGLCIISIAFLVQIGPFFSSNDITSLAHKPFNTNQQSTYSNPSRQLGGKTSRKDPLNTRCSSPSQRNNQLSSKHVFEQTTTPSMPSNSTVFNKFNPVCLLNEHSSHLLRHRLSSSIKHGQSLMDFQCTQSPCNKHSICFLGDCVCKPGYIGDNCDEKTTNPWYSKHCPNLGMEDTIDINLSISSVGGEHDSRHDSRSEPKFCSYLCYSHVNYGTAVVPVSLWKAAQQAEGDLWRQVGGWNTGKIGDSNDRAVEHWKAYDNFYCLQNQANLGDVIEVGAGPWTQLKGLLHVRSDLVVNSFTVWEPGASRYMKEVSSCAYKDGKLVKWDSSGYHPFPVVIQSEGGEKLIDFEKAFDTVITMNVLEHVQDAFEYLTGIYKILKQGGTLIMHERYYNDQTILDGDNYHPIRIKKYVLDKLLSGFQIIFNNCSAAYDGRVNDRGYYVIATKL